MKKESTTNRKVLHYKTRLLRFHTEMHKPGGICMSHVFADQSPISPSCAPFCTHSDILASMGISTAFTSEMSFKL